MRIVWTIVLFLPLLAALGLLGYFFAKKGYRKGPWNALICLGVTLVAGVVSWLLALLLSNLLAEPVTDLISDMVPANGLMLVGFVRVVAGTLAKVLVAIVSFAILFYIQLPVLGVLAKKIPVPQWDKKQATGKTGRYVGMGIRIVDAILVALLVLLPFYGLLMVGAGPAAVAAGGDKPLLESAAAHPIKYVYRYGPVAPVINTMTKVTVDSAEVNFVDVASAFGKVSEPYARATNTVAGTNVEAGNELINTLNSEVLRTSWCYHYVMQALNEMELLLNRPEFADKAEMKRDYISSFRMTEGEFYECCEPMVQTLASALQYKLQNTLLDPTQPMPELPANFLNRFGTLMNTTSPMLNVKKNILRNGLVFILENYGVDQPRARANTVLENYFGNGVMPEEYRQQEAEAIILILRARTLEEMLDAFSYNPMFADVQVCETCAGWGELLTDSGESVPCLDCWGTGIYAEIPDENGLNIQTYQP